MNADPGSVAVLDPPTTRANADRWSLVLASQGIEHRIAKAEGGWVLVVAPSNAANAASALGAYVHENPTDDDLAHQTRSRPPVPGGRWLGPAFAALIVAFHALIVFAGRHGEWIDAGASRSSLILNGRLARTVTALTLHADAGHVLANAFSGGLFLYWLGRALGPGFGLFLVVAAGALGNAANAVLRGPGHGGIGASTAVFGAVGLLAGLRAARVARGAEPARIGGWWLPLAAGVAVLALMGSSERSDVLAHATGLAAGIALGLPVGLLQRPPASLAQWAWGALAVATILGAWWSVGVPVEIGAWFAFDAATPAGLR